MSSAVLYLTPYPPIRNGIADYAAHVRSAVESTTRWRMTLPDRFQPIAGNRLRDLLRAYHRVTIWRASGLLDRVAIAHAEIGFKQHDEFLTLAWLQRLRPDLPSCITIHDPPLVVAPVLYPLASGSSRSLVRRSLRVLDYTPPGRAAIRSVVGRANRVLVLSEQGRAAIDRLVPNGRPAQFLPHISYREPPVLRPIGYRDQPVTLLFLGFWGASKGIDVLLRAVEQLHARGVGNFRLRIAGGVEESGANRAYVAAMQAQIERSPARALIEVIGFVPDALLDATLDAADVLVLPTTRTTGLSSSAVLFRALASGLAVVASDVGVLAEDVRDQITGLLTPPGDVAALATALERVIGDPALRLALGQRAAIHLFQEHSAAIVGSIMGRVYDDLCADPADR